MPTRVVDVGLHPSHIPHLIETGGSFGQYAALSYVWGLKDQPVMALVNSFQELHNQIPLDRLPQTIRDGFFVARRLGMQHIWVDALCIIQDDLQDREREVGQMQHIFSNAHVTIVAASAASCLDGFLSDSTKVERVLGNEPCFKTFPMPFTTHDGEQGHLILQPEYRFHPMSQPVNKRAWTLEERLLSPRLLIYGTSTIVWQCQSGQWEFENRQSDFDVANVRLPAAFFRDSFTDGRHMNGLVGPEQLSELRQLWMFIIRDYTARHLTHAQDRLRAISGIAARFHQILPKSRYLAGLWHDEGKPNSVLLAQLLWNSEMLVDPQRSPPDSLAPSWSWASVEGSIVWLGEFEVDIHQPGKVLDHVVEPVSMRNPFGRVRSGTLILHGPLKSARGHVVRRSNIGAGTPDAQLWFDIQDPALAKIFKGEISKVANELIGQIVEFDLVLLLNFAGLILQPTQQPGIYVRAGMFHFLGPEDVRYHRDWESEDTIRVARDYFHDCQEQILTLV